jgi:hypothetical protein
VPKAISGFVIVKRSAGAKVYIARFREQGYAISSQKALQNQNKVTIQLPFKKNFILESVADPPEALLPWLTTELSAKAEARRQAATYPRLHRSGG